MGARRRWIRATALSLAMGAAVGTLASCGSDGSVTYAGGTFEEVDRGASTVDGAGSTTDGGAEPASADEVRARKLASEGMELLRSADTVRIGIDMVTPKGRQKASLHMDRRSNCTGTFDAGPERRGDLIMIAGGATYVRFTDASLDAIVERGALRGPETAARVRERTALARGKYLKLPARSGSGTGTGGPGAPVGQCDLDEFTEKVGTPEPDEVIKALPVTRRYGKDVTPLVEKDDGEETTVYVAASGEPYILGVEVTRSGGTLRGGVGGSGGEQTMKLRMSDYGEPVAAVAPAPGLTVDISRIGPGGPGSPGGGLFEV
ncbi:hypothetical protein CP975_21785 [Streptomyces alboniger]|uniref:Lipoprotein n=2 Tax=Streptomyces alboniger TaxID=132473 RepID=A0A5J6HK15_STRAD|nr:hypothetical protein CP975_21785 [Streptomyces alboniger]